MSLHIADHRSPQPMKGSDLRSLIDSHGIEDKYLAGALNYDIKTFRQNLKPSVDVSVKLAQAVQEKIEWLYQDALRQLLLQQSRLYETVRLNIFSDTLPNLSINELPVEPRLLTHQPHDAAPGDPPVSFRAWRKELVARIYSKKRTDPNKRLTLVMGGPGAGKTTLIKRLLSGFDDKIYPVVVPLTVYNSDQPPNSIKDAAVTFFEKRLTWSHAIGVERLLEWIKSNSEPDDQHATHSADRDCRILYLLDGFDEATFERRKLIRRHIEESDDAILITSRYVTPRLDEEGLILFRWHLGGMSHEDILDHIDAIIEKLNGMESVQGGSIWKSVQNLERFRATLTMEKRETAVDLFHTLRSYTGSLALKARTEAPSPHRDSVLFQSTNNVQHYAEARRSDELRMMSRPILLNLRLANCLDAEHPGPVKLSDLLQHYVRFLLGQWRTRRSLDPFAEGEQTSRSIEQAMSAAAFFVTKCAHVDCPMRKQELVAALEEFFASVNLEGSSVPEFVTEQIQAAKDAELLVTDDEGIVRFNAPPELFAAYFCSGFTSMAETALRYPGVGGSVDNAFLRNATVDAFLHNPNLRFYEDSMVFYLKALMDDRDFPDRTLSRYFDLFLDTPVLDPRMVGYKKEELDRFLPFNLVLLGRVFDGATMRLKHWSPFIRDLGCQVATIYHDTNFEWVYQALMPVYQQLAEFIPEELRNAEHSLDRAWRASHTCAELMAVVRRVDDVEKGDRREMLVRRLVYKMRYHGDDFDDEAFTWLKQQHDRYLEQNDQSHLLLVLNTARMIADTCHKENMSKKLENSVAETGKKLEKNKRILKDLVMNHQGGEFRLQSFVEQIVDKRVFNAMRSNPLLLHSCVPEEPEAMANCVRQISELLPEYQKRTDAAKPNRDDYKRQAAVLTVAMLIADRFDGQQLFLPRRYSLAAIGAPYDEKVDYDREELLRNLFRGAKPGLLTNADDPAHANTGKDSIGGWQPYDFYAQTIWRLLRFVPAYAPYDYLS